MSLGPFEPVLALADLPRGRMRRIAVGGREVLVCHTRGGIFALDEVCTHAYAHLSEGRLRRDRIVCPLHGAAFALQDGRVLAGPAGVPLPRHATRVVDGVIELALDPDAPPQPREDAI